MSKKPNSTPVPDAPTDAPIAAAPTAGSPPPQAKARGARKRVLGEGQGDYLIYEIIGEGQQIPKGALMPIPGVPQFEDTAKALAWIRNESGDLLSGKQVMVFRACEILSLVIQQRPTVVIQAKPKVTIAKAPETSNG
jgi:hypothetical protein